MFVPGPGRSLGVRFSSHVYTREAEPTADRRANERANEPASRGDEARMRPAYVYTGPSFRLIPTRLLVPFPTTEAWQYKPSNITAGRAVR